MKKCGRCQIIKDDLEFAKSQLTRSGGRCRTCNTEVCREYREKNIDKIKQYNKEYGTGYYQENKEEILTGKKKYYQENKEEILLDRKEYYQENRDEKLEYNKYYYQENRGQLIEDAKTYAAENIEWLREYHNRYYKERRINDPNFRIRASVSANINFYLKSNDSSKNGESCLDYLPYSINELKKHLEDQFEPWMTWENYGRYDTKIWDDNDPTTWTWQIDHVIPQSTFKYASMKDQAFKDCWALSNLRPLSSKQNFLDGVKRIRHT